MLLHSPQNIDVATVCNVVMFVYNIRNFFVPSCGRVNKFQVLAVSSSDEELRGLEISMEDLTNQNDDDDGVIEDTHE